MERIEAYEALKTAVEARAFKNGTLLKIAVEDFVESFWYGRDNATLLNADEALEGLIALHRRLILDAKSVLASEQSVVNLECLMNQVNIKTIMPALEDSRSAAGIVTFNRQRDYFIVGDIHSDDVSLCKVLQRTDFYQAICDKRAFRLVFLGDYVDRGQSHLKTMEWVLLLKVLFPEVVCLLRGNHDGGKISIDGPVLLPYRIPEKDNPLSYFPRYLEQLVAINGSVAPELIDSYLDFFDTLPYMAFIKYPKGVVACVHGGLPKPQIEAMAEGESTCHYSHLKRLSDLTMYPILDNSGATICENLMWSDPLRAGEAQDLSKKRFNYSSEDFEVFCNRFGIDILFRGHEVVEDGVREHFEKRLYTVFSSGHSKTSFYHWVNPKIVWLQNGGTIEALTLYEE